MNRTVLVQYFAILREQRGLAEERLETAASTAADLYLDLSRKHGFSLTAERVRVALNGDFSSWGAALKDGDTVALIPPVAGG